MRTTPNPDHFFHFKFHNSKSAINETIMQFLDRSACLPSSFCPLICDHEFGAIKASRLNRDRMFFSYRNPKCFWTDVDQQMTQLCHDLVNDSFNSFPVANTAQYTHHVPQLNQYQDYDYGHYDNGHYDNGQYDNGQYY